MYDINLVNKGAFADGSTVSVWSSASGSASILYTADDFAGILTGNYSTSLGAKWYQLLSLDGASIYGYVREDTVTIKTVNPIEYNTAQGIINQIIENDKQTLTNLLVASKCCTLLDKKGYDTSNYKKKIKEVYISLYNRNQKMSRSSTLKDKQYGRSNLTDFADDLAKIVNDSSISIALTVTAIVTIIIVAFVAGSTAAYYVFRYSSTKSKADLTLSKEIIKILDKLPAEEKKYVIDYMQGQVNDNYNSGFNAGRFAGLNWFDILKYGAVAVGTFFVIKYVRENL